MNQTGESHKYFHISAIITERSWYDQYVIRCCLKGEVPLTLKQARQSHKKKKNKRWP